ncbi:MULTISPECIES: flagellar basal-body rod protein FlgF [Microbulbifer]|uniref:flagellar basal-body rod protein FlgF n=1 Tax=Microbulbifer TaxID=48073 RepID=UPI001E331FCB|nr:MULTISPECIES: flagellar basal-body rod protein FlgF [Microbulbifer]UHQ56889.1 flagellar basal-body rod protein FlgF [Microbulbifer sp. YPW16]
MLSTVFSSLAGLQTFSKGLDVISGNVANVNTPGYKGNQAVFADVYYGYQYSDGDRPYLENGITGAGSEVIQTTINFSQGDLRDTGNDTDLAIDGEGFFILEEDGKRFYSRFGQFSFDNDDYLVSPSGAKVMALDDAGNLVPLSLDGLKTMPARPTENLTFLGNLSLGSTQHVISDVEVIDSLGSTQVLTLTFRNNNANTPRSWFVDVRDADNNLVASDLEIRFQDNGSPADGFNTVSFDFQPQDRANQNITLNFGDVGSFAFATSFSGASASDLALEDNDGYQQGALLGLSFNEDGVLEANYSNEETQQGQQIALAHIHDKQALTQLGQGLFEANPQQTIEIGQPNQDIYGLVLGQKLEASNVELSQQFTDMVVVQRGYQASSQMLTAVNEMMQQLLEASK